MDLLASLFATGGTPGPTDDWWFGPAGTMTAAGIRVDAEGAKKISAWYRGRDILATSLAMLPLKLFARLPDDEGATPARNHALYDVLGRKPNPADDSFTWRRAKMQDLIDTGHAYSRIGIGQDWTLTRLDPSKVTRKQTVSGRTIYEVRKDTGQPETLTQDEVFHLRASDDKGVLDRARDSLGLSMALDGYAQRVFGTGTMHSGLIEVPGPMGDESARAMAKSFLTAAGDWHLPKVLPQGAKWVANDSMTPDKAQMLTSRQFSVTDIARWLGLPPHMLADLTKSSFSNIEHQGQEFVTYSLGPWLSLWEFGINDQLILQPAKFYAEFVRDALVRGDIAARWQAYQIAVSTGTWTRNEVRRKENMNALDGLDKPLDPAHLTGKQAEQQPAEKPEPPDDPEPDEPADDAKAQAIAQASAARLLRKEVAAVQKLAVRFAADGDAFAGAVAEFYAKHRELVAETLQLSERASEDYCASQASQAVSENWIGALTLWQEPHYAAGLAAIALEAAA